MEKELILRVLQHGYMDSSNRPSKRWRPLEHIKSIQKLLVSLIATFLAILYAIYYIENDSHIVAKWNIAGKMSSALGGTMPNISIFDAELILSVLVLLIVVALIILTVIGVVERRNHMARQETERRINEAKAAMSKRRTLILNEKGLFHLVMDYIEVVIGTKELIISSGGSRSLFSPTIDLSKLTEEQKTAFDTIKNIREKLNELNENLERDL